MEERKCACCGAMLTRKRYKSGRLEDRTVFEKRKFCSQSCANTRNAETKEEKAKMATAKNKGPGQGLKKHAKNLSPLDHMLQVMRDPNEPAERRDRMAIAAAKYCHPIIGAGGKKEQQAEAAKVAGEGFFRPMQSPKVLAFKGNNQD